MIPISSEIIDGIKELINIGIGCAAGMLNELTKSHVTLHVPEIRLITAGELDSLPGCQTTFSLISMDYTGPISGTTALMFPRESALQLVMLLAGEEAQAPEMDSIRSETLLEVGNIIINAVMGSISNNIGERLRYQLPGYVEDSLTHLVQSDRWSDDDLVILAHTRFLVQEKNISGDILIILEMGSIDRISRTINRIIGAETEK